MNVKRIVRTLGVAAVVATATDVVASPAPGFYPIGNVAPSHTYSFGTAISADGLVVGGESGLSSFGPADTSGGIWQGAGWQTKSSLPSTNTIEPYSLIWDLNQDGSVGVGLTAIPSGDPNDPTVSVPFRWTPGGGVQLLSNLSGQAYAVSSDGSVVVGQVSGGATPLSAFRWTQSTGVEILPTLGATSTGLHIAYATSADGGVIVGRSRKASVTTNSAFAWTAALGSVELPELPGATGTTRTNARGVNAAGDVIVGLARDSSGAPIAARWAFDRITGVSSVTSLGDLPGGIVPDGVAYGVSDDGLTIIGQSEGESGDEAFLWRAELGGMVSLRSYLIDSLGATNLTDWVLDSAEDISGDGTIITGYGTLNGATQAWVAVIPPIPEPSSLALALIAAPLFGRCRD
jgi:uncharacterized membrane protein